MASVPQPSIGSARQELYRRMDRNNLTPLWEVLHNLIPNEPSTPSKPALWKYRDARPFLMEAGKLITAREAIRRVLILENPGMRGESCITQSLYAGLQLMWLIRCRMTSRRFARGSSRLTKNDAVM